MNEASRNVLTTLYCWWLSLDQNLGHRDVEIAEMLIEPLLQRLQPLLPLLQIQVAAASVADDEYHEVDLNYYWSWQTEYYCLTWM